jgi:hypothetical protein
MAKKNDAETKTIEGRILTSLLEGSKTNTQLLEELGYNTNQHGSISKPLKNLNRKLFIGYEKVKSEKIDDSCKLWSLITSYKNVKEMLKEYPYLFSKIHKNEIILDNMLGTQKCSETVFDPAQGIPVTHTYLLPEVVKTDLKEKMKLSPEFFKYYFITTNVSQENAGELTELVIKLENKILNAENGRFGNSPNAQTDIATIFYVCVLYDVMKGQSSEEAKEYLLSSRRKVFDIDSMQVT